MSDPNDPKHPEHSEPEPVSDWNVVDPTSEPKPQPGGDNPGESELERAGAARQAEKEADARSAEQEAKARIAEQEAEARIAEQEAEARIAEQEAEARIAEQEAASRRAQEEAEARIAEQQAVARRNAERHGVGDEADTSGETRHTPQPAEPIDTELPPAAAAPTEPPARAGFLSFFLGALVLAATLALYGATLLPGAGNGEDAAQQLAAQRLALGGGAEDHPLFVALGHLGTRLGVVDPATSVNALAAVCGGLTALLVFLCVARLLDHARIGTPRSRLLFAVAGAGSLVVAHAFWLRSVTPAPAALNALLFALVVWLWIRRLTGAGPWNLFVAAMCLGLAVAVDVGMLAFIPVFLLSAFWLVWRPQSDKERESGKRRGFGAALTSVLFALLVGLAPWLALQVGELMQTSAELAGGDQYRPLDTVRSVWQHAASGRLWPPVGAAEGAARFGQWATVHLYSFLAVATLLGILGAITIPGRRGTVRAGLLLVVLFAVAILTVVYLPAADTGAAALPGAVIFAIWVGAGAAVLFRRASPVIATILLALVLGTPVAAYLGAARATDHPTLARVAGAVGRRADGDAATRLVPWRQGFQSAVQTMGPLSQLQADSTILVAEDPAGNLLHALRLNQAQGHINPGVTITHVPVGESTDVVNAAVVALSGTKPGAPVVVCGSRTDVLTPALESFAELRPLGDGVIALERINRLVVTQAAQTLQGVNRGRTQPDPHIPPGTPQQEDHRPAEPEPAQPWSRGEREPTTVVTIPPPGWRHDAPADSTPVAAPTEAAADSSALTPPVDSGAVTPSGAAATDTAAAMPQPVHRSSENARRPEGTRTGGLIRTTPLAQADSLFVAGNYAAAADAYTTVLGAESGETPAPSLALARYAVALAHAGRSAESSTIRHRYLNAVSNAARANSELGSLFLEAQRPREALVHLKTAAQRQPDDASARAMVGLAFLQAAAPDSARPYLEQALAMEPQHAMATYFLGRVCEAQGDNDCARAAYEGYLGLGGDRRHAADAATRLQALVDAESE